MAAASTAFRLCARVIARPRPASALHARPLIQRRTLSSTPLRWRPAKDPENDEDDEAAAFDDDMSFSEERVPDEEFLKSLPAEFRTPEIMEAAKGVMADVDMASEEDELHTKWDDMEEKLFKDPRPQKDSFWFDEEDDDPSTADIEGDDFDDDDITSTGHGKLEEVREMRQYARIIAWEMPMLSSTYSPGLQAFKGDKVCSLLTPRQNSRSGSSPLPRSRSSATATRLTWASTIPRSARSS